MLLFDSRSFSDDEVVGIAIAMVFGGALLGLMAGWVLGLKSAAAATKTAYGRG